MLLIKVVLVIIAVFSLYLLRPFRAPAGLCIFLGVPGSGKTTLAAHFARTWKGDRVFSNVSIKNTLKYSAKDDLGSYLIEDCLMILDEAGLEFNNRFYKNLQHKIIEFAKLFRHFHIHSFCLFSQSLDTDITFVRLANRIYILKKLPFFVFCIGVKPRIGIDAVSQQPALLYRYRFFDMHLVPAWPNWRLFDTYARPDLPEKDWPIW